MRKLLSTTALAAALVLGGAAAWAQTGAAGGAGSGAAAGGSAGSSGTAGAAGAQAQSGGTAGSTGGGANQSAQGGATGGSAGGSAQDAASGANRPTMAPNQPPLGQQTGGMMSESQVRDMLSKQDFHNVENVTRSGDSWHARAMQNGRPVDLTVDATTGTIRSQAAAR